MAASGQQSLKPLPRSGHVAVSVGRYMLVWGGYTDYMYSDIVEIVEEKYLPADEIWAYDVDRQRWTKVTATGDAPLGTSGAIAVLVDQDMYVTGGHMNNGNSCETYRLHLPSSTWHHIDIPLDTNKFSPRDKFVGWKYDNRIYIFGGYGYPFNGYVHEHGSHFSDESTGSARGWNNQLVYLDLASPNAWHNPKCMGDIPSSRAAHAAVCLGDQVFLFGGRHNDRRLNDLHILHMQSMVWRRVDIQGFVPEGRSWHSLTAISSRHLFLYGGYSQQQQPLRDGWLLDTVSLQWTQLPLPDTRPCLWHTACSFEDGEILVFGGCHSDILNIERPMEHSNQLLDLHCSPKSLVKLGLDAVIKYRAMLETDWDCLPKSLGNILRARVQDQPTEECNDEQKTRSCVIS